MATSSYSDSTTATYNSGWVLVEYNPGYEYKGAPNDPNQNQRRQKNVLMRYRDLKGSIVYSPQEGQIGVGSDLASSNGDTSPYPAGTKGYLCTEDKLSLPQAGTGICRQTQIWEHFTEWADYDISVLA